MWNMAAGTSDNHTLAGKDHTQMVRFVILLAQNKEIDQRQASLFYYLVWV